MNNHSTKPNLDLAETAGFYARSVNLFLHRQSGHMGADGYCDHNGNYTSRDTRGYLHCESMSGIETWSEHARLGTLPRLSKRLFKAVTTSLAPLVEPGLPIIEYGPGTMNEARLLVEMTKSKLYIPVDLSEAIIEKARDFALRNKGCTVQPRHIDFFSSDNKALVHTPALAVLLGMTINNIPGPALSRPPEDRLVTAFRNLCKPIGFAGGHLLVATHAEQDAQRNIELYKEKWHDKFSRNLPYRMKAELPMNGFNPDLFDYLPLWHPQCSLLAHTLRATKDQTFTMGDEAEIQIDIKAGDIFHYNNSFKFLPEFFESCAHQAGITITEKWRDEDNLMMYLFKVPATKSRFALVANE